MQTEILDIQAYNLAEFCQKVQAGFEAGFEFDFETNARYPTSFGSFYSAVLRKKQQTITSELAADSEVALEGSKTASDNESAVVDTNVVPTVFNDPTATVDTAQKRSKVK
jgi:hypothetical protein